MIEKVEAILESSLAHQGYSIVRIQLSGGLKKTLQIMIERSNGEDVNIDDCVNVSRRASVLLAVDDPIPFAYVLEVSSPGMDRPLVKPQDFIRFIGHAAQINVAEALHDRKRLIGRIEKADESGVTLSLSATGEDVLLCDIPYYMIQKAKLFVDFEQSLAKKGKNSGQPKD